MDYDSLKDSWSDVEDRDGVRLSWNTFPSSRMVTCDRFDANLGAKSFVGSFSSCCSHRCGIYSAEGEA